MVHSFFGPNKLYIGELPESLFLSFVLLSSNLPRNATFGGRFLAEQQNGDALHLLAESWDGDGTIGAEVKEEYVEKTLIHSGLLINKEGRQIPL